MDMLPDINKGLVKYLLDFIATVASHSDKNKMTLSNLATGLLFYCRRVVVLLMDVTCSVWTYSLEIR